MAGESIVLEQRDKRARYQELAPQLGALVEGEPDLIANLANLAAALMEGIAAASWVGFYLVREGELVLGPFQGKIACTRIAIGRGVCGAAAARRETQVVDDVDQFPGHIACDAGSKSEIVVPIVSGETLVGVLDVDSYRPAAFDEVDAEHLEQVAKLAATFDWPVS